MATQRMSFDDLPPTVLSHVETHAGEIIKTETVIQGFNSEIAARIFTTDGSFFVKGLRADHKRVWTQSREAEVNPYLRGIAPELHWQVKDAGWVLLGFEALDGHHADYSAGSPDLPKVADLLCRLGEVPCPAIELRHAEQRLEAYVAKPTDVAHFAGNSLLHTDLNNENVMVDGPAFLVDWAWATRGAAWLDAAHWVVWLMAAGQLEPQSAEGWAARVPAWKTAAPEAVTAFALASANLWEDIASADPGTWTTTVFDASQRWAEHRKTV
ncbi:aminoglycoside phosphotransferase [Streptomyces sp. NPDC088812]|uniref:aminoglycoside phosphotransferase n=1 Tax=Streptomyces sp. NPDC088812 TaxID=3365905 RepID=UPI00381B0A6A